MIGLRLVRLIEKHSVEIADALMNRLRTSERTLGYRDISQEELRSSLVLLYTHLEEWLLSKTESDIEILFKAIGAKRASENIPTNQMAWAIHMSKTQLWGFVHQESSAEKAMELYGELELLETLDRFFDHATCYALMGYEQRAQAHKAA